MALHCMALIACGRSEPLRARVRPSDAGVVRVDAGTPADAGGLGFHDAGVIMTQVMPCRGYTWVLRRQVGDVSHVGSDDLSNAYTGDTQCGVSLPMLCVKLTGEAPPTDLVTSQYDGWFDGRLGITDSVVGYELVTHERGDAICAEVLGVGFRMAEHHDGRGVTGGFTGWGFGAWGHVPAGRYWAAIDDQPANPWSFLSP